jgi:hypothetical protein
MDQFGGVDGERSAWPNTAQTVSRASACPGGLGIGASGVIPPKPSSWLRRPASPGKMARVCTLGYCDGQDHVMSVAVEAT